MKTLLFCLAMLAGRNGVAQETSSSPNNTGSRPDKLKGLYLNFGFGGWLFCQVG